jgi:IPT/TIG domain
MRAVSYRVGVTAAILVLSLFVAGQALAVTITLVTPATDFIPEVANACVGTSVTITGSGFVNDGGPVSVAFNGTPAINVTIGSDAVIYAKMPGNATPGNITVTTAKGTATSPLAYSVFPCAASSGATLLPTTTTPAKPKASVSGFAPTKGKAGAKIVITGTNLTGATSVKIGGAAAIFKINSSTKITATVPLKAKSGKVSVTTPYGTATSSTSFTRV